MKELTASVLNPQSLWIALHGWGLCMSLFLCVLGVFAKEKTW